MSDLGHLVWIIPLALLAGCLWAAWLVWFVRRKSLPRDD